MTRSNEAASGPSKALVTKRVVLALLLAAWPASAEDGAAAASAEPALGCATTAVRKVQQRYDGVRDLAARFQQETQSVAFGGASDPDAVSGRVVFAKPGRMRWEYEKPEPSLVVTDGKVLWIYDPAAREAQKLAVDEGYLSGAAIQFLLGEGTILDSFEVTARECAEARVELELRPREPATYEQIDLSVDPATGWILATTVHDLFGNRTRVSFSDPRPNEGAPEELFRFEPPDGVRVLSLEAPPG
jgi:outer membrane lipoprotein carrier protein